MKFRPSLDGHYKRLWSKNEYFEDVKCRIRCGEVYLREERLALEVELRSHVRACYHDLQVRTTGLLCNPTWRRLILFAKWAHLQRRVRARSTSSRR